ncbi:MAG: hypothetical protein DYG92_05035 [Leptolyngbya sp. PLA1]|nr:hypothetical protein [Leptolyngbya sp. PLA1]
MTGAGGIRAVDELMEKASEALVATDYFEAEKHCLRALARARSGRDFERMARISLPLQECRRQRRHEACDAGHVRVLSEMPAAGTKLGAGVYLLTPPLIGLHGRTLRDLLTRRKVPAMVLVREPTTAKGQWPIVGVGVGEPRPVVVRAYVDPPAAREPDASYLLAAQEALGDAAIRKAPSSAPPDHHVDDLWEYWEAVPDHEKLAQAFEDACRAAAASGVDSGPRRRGFDDPFSF